MSTAPRKRSEGDVYHVVVRGVGQQIIFEDDADRNWFMTALRDKAEELGVQIWAWCLMSNHVHLVMKAPLEDVVVFMRQLQSRYALYFNRRHERAGTLFQGRFTSVPIENDEQLITAIRYLHLNPVKAGDALDSPWTSYNAYAEGRMTGDGAALVLEVFGGVDNFKRSHADNAAVVEPKLPRHRLNENDALALAQTTVAPLSLHDVKSLPKDERNAHIRALKAAGLSVRQIARFTGIGQNIVARTK